MSLYCSTVRFCPPHHLNPNQNKKFIFDLIWFNLRIFFCPKKKILRIFWSSYRIELNQTIIGWFSVIYSVGFSYYNVHYRNHYINHQIPIPIVSHLTSTPMARPTNCALHSHCHRSAVIDTWENIPKKQITIFIASCYYSGDFLNVSYQLRFVLWSFIINQALRAAELALISFQKQKNQHNIVALF